MRMEGNMKPFLKDFMENLIEGNSRKPFVSFKISTWDAPTMLFALSVLDLPIGLTTSQAFPHEIDSDGQRGVIIKAGTEAIIYK